MRISDWSSDVCSSDLRGTDRGHATGVSLLVTGDELGEDLHGDGVHSGEGVETSGSRSASAGASGSSTSSNEAIRASTRPIIFSGPGTTLANTSADRKSGVSGKSVSVRVDHGGGRIIKKKNNIKKK